MSEQSFGFERFLLKIGLLVLLALFAVPALTWCFSQYMMTHHDLRGTGERANLEVNIQKDGKTRPATASDICQLPENAQTENLRKTFCPRYGKAWQALFAHRLAGWTLFGGFCLLLAILLLGLLAFASRSLQYKSFVLGQHLVMFASAVTVLFQGGMCVWLSFWIPGHFLNFSPVQLIFVVGLAVLTGVGLIVLEIFRSPKMNDEIEGELIVRNEAPRLWQRIAQMAAQLKTDPPKYLIAGIDDNFFVTEAPLTVGGKALQGRKLFVSIPLLRQLESAEADAVLAHELAHFAGGDTRDSARLAPRLIQYDSYLDNIQSAKIACLVWPFMVFYRLIFDCALSRDSRAREFQADNTAATLVSPQAVIRSLIKIEAYSAYRTEIEEELFGHYEKLDARLNIATRVAKGLYAWVQSPEFVRQMSNAHMPHPLDSHPPLRERMKNVHHVIPAHRFAEVIQRPPETSWVDKMPSADVVEARLWSTYEHAFARAHEKDLAYRYNPANRNERELVLKHFPPMRFRISKQQQIEINCEAIVPSGSRPIPYGVIENLGFDDNYLVIWTVGHGMTFDKEIRVSLHGFQGSRFQVFQDTLQRYWWRHQVMREYQQH